MKIKYLSPTILIEDLGKNDVLLSSGPITPPDPGSSSKEKENTYFDIERFLVSEDWFS